MSMLRTVLNVAQWLLSICQRHGSYASLWCIKFCHSSFSQSQAGAHDEQAGTGDTTTRVVGRYCCHDDDSHEVMKGLTQLRAPLSCSKVCQLFHVHEAGDERCDEESMLSTWDWSPGSWMEST